MTDETKIWRVVEEGTRVVIRQGKTLVIKNQELIYSKEQLEEICTRHNNKLQP